MLFTTLALSMACLVFGQANITVKYDPSSDKLKAQGLVTTQLSLSGAAIAIAGNEGRWEKKFVRSGGEVEAVVFTELDPNNKHTLSVRLRDGEALNGIRPGKGYEGGEALIYQIPAGSYQLELVVVACEGKKVDVWASYGLLPAGSKKPITPVGYEKGCKSKWLWEKQ
jgi:hypothetical protein